MKNISWKTGAVGGIGLIILFTGLALVYFGKATFKEVAESLSYITLFLTGLAALFAKDGDKTGLPRKAVK